MTAELERDIKRTLRDILGFAGADEKYAEYAQLQTYLERLIDRNK